MSLIYKLLPFYAGILLGYFTFLRPENAWIYGLFGGLVIGIFLREDMLDAFNKKKQEAPDDGHD